MKYRDKRVAAVGVLAVIWLAMTAGIAYCWEYYLLLHFGAGILAYRNLRKIDKLEGKFPARIDWEQAQTSIKKCLFLGVLALMLTQWGYHSAKKQYKDNDDGGGVYEEEAETEKRQEEREVAASFIFR